MQQAARWDRAAADRQQLVPPGLRHRRQPRRGALHRLAAAASKGFPLDYCSLVCNELRLREPVNYLRANWIRPEDLHLYEAMGYHNFKIVERNTPTQILLDRVKAYSERRYDGNLLDLVQNYAYPEEKFGDEAKDAYSYRRMLKYFVKPRAVNLIKFRKVMRLRPRGAACSTPGAGPTRCRSTTARWTASSTASRRRAARTLDCEACRYCHEWAERVVKIDPRWAARMSGTYDDLLGEIDRGRLLGSLHQDAGPGGAAAGELRGRRWSSSAATDPGALADPVRDAVRRGVENLAAAAGSRRRLARRLRRPDVPAADVRRRAPHRPTHDPRRDPRGQMVAYFEACSAATAAWACTPRPAALHVHHRR